MANAKKIWKNHTVISSIEDDVTKGVPYLSKEQPKQLLK
jgi:hypothetical protein